MDLKENDDIILKGKRYSIIEINDSVMELIDEFGKGEQIPVNEVMKNGQKGVKSHDITDQKKIDEAKNRYKLIEPLIQKKGSRAEVEKLAKEKNVSPATIYRWIKSYKDTGLLSSLIPKERNGGKGKSRLNDEIDQILKEKIDVYYQSDQKNSIQKVYKEVKLECITRKIECPHYNTVRRRIAALREYEVVKNRLGKPAARKRFDPKVGTNRDATFPLSSVQIDHTPTDIIIVDEKYRKSIGRLWLTLAIDIYSRMVLGFYLGFEKPNAMSVGLCLSRCILPKDELLASLNIYAEWPCFGIPRAVHVDNAMEFRSKMLESACLEYSIDINWRPVKQPQYGGHIERLLGTFMKEIHSLEGTTFNNTEKRINYDSEGRAVFTHDEFEKWFTIYIVEIYHKTFHQGIKTTPLDKWNQGIYGDDETIGTGYQSVDIDKRKLLLDFMPFHERTIQDYGVLIDGIYYYNDTLRRWINSVDVKSGKLRAKKKFIFKTDPRDISLVYFFDPEIKEYFPIPYRDTSHPPITKWELKSIRDELFRQGMKNVDENAIFSAYKKLKDIENQAKLTTKKTRRLDDIKNKQKAHKQQLTLDSKESKDPEQSSKKLPDIFDDIEPFEDIDDEL